MNKPPKPIRQEETTDEGTTRMKDAATTQPEKLDLRSHDAAGDKIAELL